MEEIFYFATHMTWQRFVLSFAVIAILTFIVDLISSKIGSAITHRRNDKRDLNYFRDTFLSRDISTAMLNDGVINCKLQSIDGGKTWLVIDKERHVIGYVEDVHPGLIEHIEASDRLCEFAESGKRIDLSKEGDRRLLTDFGFEIQKTE